MPLNDTYPDLLVNFLTCKETDAKGKTTTFTWVTDITITEENVYDLMRGGRTRWKIENETFNTLKNQGYQFEHNFGHGKENLNVVFAMLMFLAFAIDQLQEMGCFFFRQQDKERAAVQSYGEKSIRVLKHSTLAPGRTCSNPSQTAIKGFS